MSISLRTAASTISTVEHKRLGTKDVAYVSYIRYGVPNFVTSPKAIYLHSKGTTIQGLTPGQTVRLTGSDKVTVLFYTDGRVEIVTEQTDFETQVAWAHANTSVDKAINAAKCLRDEFDLSLSDAVDVINKVRHDVGGYPMLAGRSVRHF